MAPEKTKRLGRGLDALLSPATAAPGDLRFPTRADQAESPGFRTIPVSAIVPNPLQPRKDFHESELAELRSSIRSNGLLQPLLVRPKGSGFELVAGERRLRAVQSLGWREVPAHVREMDDQAILTLALIENLQRADLNPIEEGEGYQELIDRFTLTQQQVADAVGRERSTVANMLRLLALPEPVRKMVRATELSLGHARALLGLQDTRQMLALATEVVGSGLTVREVERRVREAAVDTPSRRKPKLAVVTSQPPEARVIEEQLRRKYQTDARVITGGEGKGEVRLSFYSVDDLERLLDLMLGPSREAL